MKQEQAKSENLNKTEMLKALLSSLAWLALGIVTSSLFIFIAEIENTNEITIAYLPAALFTLLGAKKRNLFSSKESGENAGRRQKLWVNVGNGLGLIYIFVVLTVGFLVI